MRRRTSTIVVQESNAARSNILSGSARYYDINNSIPAYSAGILYGMGKGIGLT